MSRFAQAIGIWEITLEGFAFKLKPKVGDNYELTGIMTKAKQHLNRSDLFKEIGAFFKKLVLRDYTDLTEEEKAELDFNIEYNIAFIMKELLIAFKWTTREKYDEIEKKELVKNEGTLTP